MVVYAKHIKVCDNWKKEKLKVKFLCKLNYKIELWKKYRDFMCKVIDYKVYKEIC